MEFKTEGFLSCSNDYLEVTDGGNKAKFCGDEKAGQVLGTSSGNTLTLRFHSDWSRNQKGFKIIYSTV